MIDPFEQIAYSACSELRGLQHPRELALLLRVVNELRPRVVVEIGTRTGATLWAFSRVTGEGCCLVSIDPTNQRRMLQQLVGEERELHLITGRSQDAATLIELERVLDARPVDFLFVDGSHLEPDVRRDVELYAPLLSPAGILALHDVATVSPETGCAVGAVWSALRGLPGAYEIVDPAGVPAYGIGVVPGCARSAPARAGARAVAAGG